MSATGRVLLCMSGPDHAPHMLSFDNFDTAELDLRALWGITVSNTGLVDRNGREVAKELRNDSEIWTVSDGVMHWAAFFYWGDL